MVGVMRQGQEVSPTKVTHGALVQMGKDIYTYCLHDINMTAREASDLPFLKSFSLCSNLMPMFEENETLCLFHKLD